jgi:hypothetical protein
MELIRPNQFHELGPGIPDKSMFARLDALTVAELFAGRTIVDQQMANCCLSALWLYYNFLDRSHEISQSIATCEGSYWHAIMHRREGDYSNAKYWVRRVGQHPVYEALAQAAQSPSIGATAHVASQLVRSREWDPCAWVDLCQRAVDGNRELVAPCQQLQQIEWELLFAYCYQGAIASAKR